MPKSLNYSNYYLGCTQEEQRLIVRFRRLFLLLENLIIALITVTQHYNYLIFVIHTAGNIRDFVFNFYNRRLSQPVA